MSLPNNVLPNDTPSKNAKSENIKVCVRMRPLLRNERKTGNCEVWGVDNGRKIRSLPQATAKNGYVGQSKSFEYNFGLPLLPHKHISANLDSHSFFPSSF